MAIDGHSSCGKSTLAKDLAKALDYLYIDSGAMYRAVTYYFLQHAIDMEDAKAVDHALDNISINFQQQDGQHFTFLNGTNVENEIRQMQVSKKVSPVAAISAVRRNLVAQQQQMGQRKGIVMDGRDIGTVVFPQARLKLFLTANIDIRAQRRYEELLAKGVDAELESVTANLMERDHIDSTRNDSPLRKANDAIVIDNSNLNREEQLQMVLVLAKLRIKKSILKPH